ncbi:DsbA family protein [Patescibacteria group bacterium]|nr:DsbA family protein [Patescibacteria group bacterium]
MKNPWVIIGVLMVVLIGGSVWYSNSVSATYNEGVEVKAHIKGGENAAVTLVEYSDFQCPACGAFQPVLNEVLAQYGDKIKFEYKHYPLVQIHPFAEPAARAAEAAAQQGKFFEFADMLFEKQAEWSKGSNPTGFFTRYATELGLDMELFAKHQKSSLLSDNVRAHMAEARGLGLTGTPSFYLNGVKMENSTFEDFKAQIEAAVNPQVDFNLPSEELRMIPVEGEASTTAEATATPAVQFGI